MRSRSIMTPAASSGPASEPRPASSTPATKRRPKERSKRNRRAAVRRVRRRFGGLEEPDSVWRPVGGEGLADDPVTGDWSPEAAVRTLPTVVAHHEVMVGRDGDGIGQIAGSAGGTGADEVLLRHLPVDHGMAVLDAERVAGPGNDPLDEVGARLLRDGLVAGGAL